MQSNYHRCHTRPQVDPKRKKYVPKITMYPVTFNKFVVSFLNEVSQKFQNISTPIVDEQRYF